MNPIGKSLAQSIIAFFLQILNLSVTNSNGDPACTEGMYSERVTTNQRAVNYSVSLEEPLPYIPFLRDPIAL